jgi:glycogen phosphorylase
MGPHLGNNLINLDIAAARCEQRWPSWASTCLMPCSARRRSPGLGNGGLGRLAACYLDSLATLEIPGGGLRHPLRVRHLRPGDPRRLAGGDGRQVAALRQPVGDLPARVVREVGFGGHTERYTDDQRPLRVRWVPARGARRALRHADPGYRSTPPTPAAVEAEAAESFDFRRPSTGRLLRRRRTRRSAPRTSAKVLYPNDDTMQGKRCGSSSSTSSSPARCRTCCASCTFSGRPPPSHLPREVRRSAQRHAPGHRRRRADAPAARRARPGWDEAWEITQKPSAYTNHTLLPEALEKWPRRCSAAAAAPPRDHLRDQPPLPRRGARAFPGDEARVARMSLIDEAASATCAWPTWPASAATPSTASPPCTPNCSSARCCATSTNSGPTLQQQDQRRHPARFAPQQPGPGR